ncbi:hypothetical protein JOB18_035771 [Solea senegalensis]|uniref:Uncharacterized protein n=1 Tax=Solea senegalensis TaxID=28829 RepID=A0AAV6SKG1_SOLSE|nr:hypothetical protein JOB18_035771 [Solea senegalensis]
MADVNKNNDTTLMIRRFKENNQQLNKFGIVLQSRKDGGIVSPSLIEGEVYKTKKGVKLINRRITRPRVSTVNLRLRCFQAKSSISVNELHWLDLEFHKALRGGNRIGSSRDQSSRVVIADYRAMSTRKEFGTELNPS